MVDIWLKFSYDSNLEYLLSMGVKSIPDIIQSNPKDIDNFLSIVLYYM